MEGDGQGQAGEGRMKKWREWLFLVFLLALAVAGGWSKERQAASFAEANIETDQG
jgi:hypothetical protein